MIEYQDHQTESVIDPVTTQGPDHQQNAQQNFNCLATNHTRKQYLKTKDLILKLETNKGTLWFLQQCQKQNKPPKQLTVSQANIKLTSHLAKKWNDVEFSASIKLLKLAIIDAEFKVKELENEFEEKKELLLELIPTEERVRMAEHLNEISKKCHSKKKDQNTKKLNWQLENSKCSGAFPSHLKSKNRRFLKKSEYTQRKNFDKKKTPQLFVNFSKHVTFDQYTTDLIEKGSTFVPMPQTINKTEAQASCLRFDRKCLWKAALYNEDAEEEVYIPPLFPQTKFNMPKQSPPKALEDALTGIRTGILSAPLNHVRDNLSPYERNAIKNLVQLRNEGHIVIQPMDKTGGLAVFDRKDYVEGLEKILTEKAQFVGETTENKDFYQPALIEHLNEGLILIQEQVEKGLNNGWISKDEAKAMAPTEAKPGRLYGLAKVHKKVKEGEIPPFRPIVSGSGSLTENISKFVDFHGKPLLSSLPSYIEDTPDLLRSLEDLKTEEFPEEAIPVTIDVVGLYSNIPQAQAFDCMQKAFNTRPKSLQDSVPTIFLMNLLTLVLTLNIFTFDNALYLQLWGIAMGTICAPTVANIFMGVFEKDLLERAPGKQYIYKKFWRRFIDDILLIWTGSEEELKEFLAFMDSIHPTIKFTSDYNFQTKSVAFLDTRITIKNGKLTTDLYKKETHSAQYLLPSSTHPPHCTKNIPYSLAYRLRRICSEEEDFEERLTELRNMLQVRKYRRKTIDEAFDRARKISRQEALKKVQRQNSSQGKVTFVIPFDPRLPQISKIIQNQFALMKQDPLCAKIFEKGVQVAYRRHNNIRDILCRATLATIKNRTSNREQRGWKKCPRDGCLTCGYSKNMSQFTVTATGEKITIRQNITCTDKNVIYCIQCTKCHMQYVGKTTSKFKDRATAHRFSVDNQKSCPISDHFNLPGHNKNNMFFFAFEKVVQDDPFIVGARERFYIDKMEVIQHGINKNRTNK